MTHATETRIAYRLFLITLKLQSFDEEAVSVVQKVGNRRCIPGPTLKGAARNTLETRCQNLLEKIPEKQRDQFLPCIPVTQLSPAEADAIREGKYKRACRFDRDQPAAVCPVCYCYGAQGLVGFVDLPCLFELPNQANVFSGVMKVLWRDDQRGWELGKSRIVELREKENVKQVVVDPWVTGYSAETILKDFVVETIRGVMALGSKGRCQVKVTVEPFEAGVE